MISTLKTIILVVATLVALTLVVYSNFDALMNEAQDILIPESEDPTDGASTQYERTREAYDSFDEIKAILTAANTTDGICVDSHNSFSSAMKHPLASLQNPESGERTKTLFLDFKSTNRGGELSLYSISSSTSSEQTQEIESVERIERFQTDIAPCVIGYPSHTSETFLAQLAQEYNDKSRYTDDIDLSGTMLTNLKDVSGANIKEGGVGRVWSRGATTLGVSSGKRDLQNSPTQAFQGLLDDGEPVPYYIPLDSDQHAIIKFDKDQHSSLTKDYMCFIASQNENVLDANRWGDREKLSDSEYRVYDQLLSNTDKTCRAR